MEGSLAVRRSVSHERMRPYIGPRSQSAGGRYRQPEPSLENVAPMLMPSGLNSMLKNTTETGDIGLFSIKPSRLPRHNANATLSSLPKASFVGHQDLAAQSPDFSLFKPPPRMDDRRRLPSYTRDVASEIASLYETTSQKSSASSRFYDDPEQRSYSMTQTSYSGSRITNHRSYASLRSQGDMSLGQRPRSPFAYPSRLKRPGFRPCSPALTDGGAVDYSRRAEIGRETSVGGTISPSTLEVGRRTPQPLGIRSDINRSRPATPANAPLSPLHREFHASSAEPPVPMMTQTTETGEPPISQGISTNTPAADGPLPSRASSSATASKVPPSPLYYDYTESFYPDNEADPSPTEDFHVAPAPPFMIERTIHEDRELSSDWSYLALTDLRGRGFLASEGLNMMQGEPPENLSTQHLDTSYMGATRSSPLRSVQVQPRSGLPGGSSEHSLIAHVDGDRESSVRNHSIRRQSGVDGTQDQPDCSSVEPSPAFERGDPNENISMTPNTTYPPTQLTSPLAPGTSSFVDGNVYEDARGVPAPEKAKAARHLSDVTVVAKQSAEELYQEKLAQFVSPSQIHPALRPEQDLPQASAEYETENGATSEDHGVSADSSSGIPAVEAPELQRKARRVSHTDFPLTKRENFRSDFTFPEDGRFKLSKYRSDGDLTSSRFGIREHNLLKQDREGRGYSAIVYTGPRNPREFCFSSSSEIISPMPIYPARELRVKNSIPQLMKSLPPLPLRQPAPPIEPVIQLTSPPKATSKESKRPAPLKLDASALAPYDDVSAIHGLRTPTSTASNTAQESPKLSKAMASNAQPFLSRFRMKARSPAMIPKPSPPATRPWNLEESYPWNKPPVPSAEPSPALVHKSSSIFTPKLRLKMVKSTESLLGTVRVNRNAAQKSSDKGDLGNPKDLFTAPSSGLTSIFRQVSRHLDGSESQAIGVAVSSDFAQAAPTESTRQKKESSQRKGVSASASMSAIMDKQEKALAQARKHQQAKTEGGKSMPKLSRAISKDLKSAGMRASNEQLAQLAQQPDQPSNEELRESLRKKMTGFRARLPMSHSRAQSRQSADIISRPKTAASSAPLISIGMDGAADVPEPPVGRSRRLKTKVSSFFKRTKSKMLGCVRTRPFTDPSVDMGANHGGLA